MASFLKSLTSDKKISQYLIDPNRELKFLSYNCLPLNVLSSGRMLDGGILIGGIGQMSAPSATAKTLIGMSLLKEAQTRGMDTVLIDCERTWSAQLGDYYGIDYSEDKLLVFQSNVISEVSEFIIKLTKDRTPEERANTFVMLDSWAALVSSRRLAKEEAGAETQMMGGDAPEKNALANLIYGKGLTAFIVNQVYQSFDTFSGESYCIPGGSRLRFSCDSILLGVSEGKKVKDDKGEVAGKVVTMKVKKGRNGKEHGKLSFRILHDSGIDPWFGLLDEAVEFGILVETKKGRSTAWHIKGQPDKCWTEDEIYCQEVWVPVCKDEGFKKYILNKFTLATSLTSDHKKNFSFSDLEKVNVSTGEIEEKPLNGEPKQSKKKK